MSKSVGKKASKTMVWLLLLLLILGLGGFGVSNFGGRVDAIGSVGERKITADTYARALRQELNAQAAETGEVMSLAAAQTAGLVDAVRSRVIADAALDNEVARLGVSVGDGQVADEVTGIDAFKGPDGAFSRETYRFVLQQNGMTEAQFEARVRDDAARALLQTAVISGLTPPETYAETLYAFIAERRSASLIRLGAADLDAPLPEPGQAEIEAHYKTSPDTYTAPRLRKITYAWLTPAMMLDQVEPDEAILRELYEQRLDEFVQPERRLVERLVFSTDEEAAAAMAAIEAGDSDFDAAVTARGLTLADVDLGDVSEVEIGGPAGAAVFALAGPGITGPHATDIGPALFRVNGILPAEETGFDEAREMLAEDAARDRAARTIAEMIADLEDRLAAGATLEELDAETDMELGRIDYTDDTDEGIAGYESFRAAAGAVTENDFPEILELEDGGVFALRLDEEVPPTLRPLDEVREQVAADWRAAETARRLAAQAEALKARLDAGEEMDVLGRPVETEAGLSRGGLTPPALSQALFALKAPGESAVVAEGDTVWLIRLDAVLPPDPADPAAEFLRQTIASEAGQGIAQDIYSQFAQSLMNAAGLTLDQAAINAVHAQFR